jgi:hypothetical protein
MSLFSNILEKLGLRKGEEEKEEQPAAKGTAGTVAAKPAAAPAKKPTDMTYHPTQPSGTSARPASTPATTGPAGTAANVAAPGQPAAVTPPAAKAISEVDVMQMLEQKAKGTGLNWKQSIADLLALLDIDNSYNARVELAKELDAPQDVMGDSARMNTWLHKTVLKKIAENGGNIPANLLD